jgi:DNA invertase Pin-like site-specific DNA recombinase
VSVGFAVIGSRRSPERSVHAAVHQCIAKLADAGDYCRAGDTFVVWKLDRLGRSKRQVLDLVEQLRAKGVGFRSLTED